MHRAPRFLLFALLLLGGCAAAPVPPLAATHPASGDALSFRAEPPADFAAAWAQIDTSA